MMFLESTNFFVRTIIFDFINMSEAIKLKFRLVPMIHVGSKDYYKNVLENIKTCDEIFYEGLALQNRKEQFYKRLGLKNLNLTFKQYRIIANKLGLVTQSEYLKLDELKEKLTHSDFDPEKGSEAWNKLGFKEKLKLSLINPMKLFIYHQGITREILAKHFMTSSEDAYLTYGPIEDVKGSSTNFMMNAREQIIFKNIRNRLEFESKVDKTIGIVYGAGHMKSISRYLIDTYNYVPISGTFMKAFNIR
jgi:hypothetical protein